MKVSVEVNVTERILRGVISILLQEGSEVTRQDIKLTIRDFVKVSGVSSLNDIELDATDDSPHGERVEWLTRKFSRTICKSQEVRASKNGEKKKKTEKR
ncbi:hypothetical protein Barb4_05566 [Bacteroidales bacterium Barb4]|nr:hypothetical protein Barb4_05566 [Bacteroidales bacterium Barb4]